MAVVLLVLHDVCKTRFLQIIMSLKCCLLFVFKIVKHSFLFQYNESPHIWHPLFDGFVDYVALQWWICHLVEVHYIHEMDGQDNRGQSSVMSIVYLFFQTLETESRERQQTLDQLTASLAASQRAQHVRHSVCYLIAIVSESCYCGHIGSNCLFYRFQSQCFITCPTFLSY